MSARLLRYSYRSPHKLARVPPPVAPIPTPAMGGAYFQSQQPAKTLKEALSEPRLNRNMAEAAKPMPNFKSTPGGPNDTPLTFWATWTLPSRPRRIALLLDDAQEEYRAYAEPILDNMAMLVKTFRAKGCPIVWSSWSRQFDDGISNAMDRWYGLRGLRESEPENAVYVFEGEAGLQPLKEVAPTAEEKANGWFYHSKMLDMFWVCAAESHAMRPWLQPMELAVSLANQPRP